MLEIGTNINGVDGNGKDDSLLLATASQYNHNLFYFKILMSLRANIILTEHEGAVVLLRLVESKNAGNIISKILREYLYFVYYIRTEPNGSS